jgi:hypothetical protein
MISTFFGDNFLQATLFLRGSNVVKWRQFAVGDNFLRDNFLLFKNRQFFARQFRRRHFFARQFTVVPNFNHGEKPLLTDCNFQKPSPKLSKSPTGENSPNLVILLKFFPCVDTV